MDMSLDLSPPVAEKQMNVAAPQEKWTTETLLSVHTWTDKLFSFTTTRSASFRFVPGQFARLGVIISETGEIVWRAYSMASANYEDHLEFFSIVVPDGAFTSRLARFAPDDTLLVEKVSYGFLTTDRFVGGRDLWLLSSGTGLAPFLSILHDPLVWNEYENIILVHSVREANELAYRKQIAEIPQHPLLCDGKARLHYIPVVTRESLPETLSTRITRLITEGTLEKKLDLPLNTEHSRLMVCGNPQMALDVREVLKQRGFQVGRRGIPGQMAFENYW